MNRPSPIVRVIDVQRVDPNEEHTFLCKMCGRFTREEGMSLEVRVRAPQSGPPRVDQHGLAADLMGQKRGAVDRPLS